MQQVNHFGITIVFPLGTLLPCNSTEFVSLLSPESSIMEIPREDRSHETRILLIVGAVVLVFMLVVLSAVGTATWVVVREVEHAEEVAALEKQRAAEEARRAAAEQAARNEPQPQPEPMRLQPAPALNPQVKPVEPPHPRC